MKLRALFTIVVLAMGLPWPVGAVTREELVCPLREDWEEGSKECPCEKGWKPTERQLLEILTIHKNWIRNRGFSDSAIAGQAVLCNADLRDANLQGEPLRGANLLGASLTGANMQGADLRDANLRKADLLGANLQEATLKDANLQEADLRNANLRKANLWEAKLQEADLREAKLQEADFSAANLYKANLAYANLRKANLKHAYSREAEFEHADLQEADLSYANLQKAGLREAKLQEADLREAKLQEADFSGANLQDANLMKANLQGSDLRFAKLQEADLRFAKLQEANLRMALVAGTKLAYSTLARAIYAPASPPPSGYLERIKGLATVKFPPGQQSGLVQLRELLRKAGLRDLEREVTFAIEHGRARHARCKLVEADVMTPEALARVKSACQEKASFLHHLGGWLQLVFFEWTTGWGLYPGRALLITLGLMIGMTVVYVFPITILPYGPGGRGGIYRIWPRDRLDPVSEPTGVAETSYAERLTAGFPAAVAWAFYFSLLSAFHIGWRDLNVGSWLTRMQFTEYALRGRGWVRFVSGLQSLISVYLVAMWVLTYFGRPFQ